MILVHIKQLNVLLSSLDETHALLDGCLIEEVQSQHTK